MLSNPYVWFVVFACAFGFACNDGTQEPVLRVVMATIVVQCLKTIVVAWEDEYERSRE